MKKVNSEQLTVEQTFIPLRLSRLASAKTPEGERREYGVQFIKAGRVRRRDGKESNWEISVEAVQGLAQSGMLARKACFIDHTLWSWVTDYYPSLRNLFAVTLNNPTYDEANQAAVGAIRCYDTEAGRLAAEFLDQIVADQEAGKETPDVGGSLTFYSRDDYVDVGEEPGEEYLRVTREFTHVESWDVVFGPGAEGRVREILSAVDPGHSPRTSANNLPNEVLDRELPRTSESARESFASLKAGHLLSPNGGVSMDPKEGQLNTGNETPAQTPPAPAPGPGGNATPPVLQTPQVILDVDGLKAQLTALAGQVSKLTSALAAQEEPNVVQGMGKPRLSGMFDSRDQVEQAYFQLMGLPTQGPVHRLSGIRELYLLLTGDREFRGEINLDLVPRQLAYNSSGNNADTTTMAELTRNVMNKALINQIELLEEYNWWRRIVLIDNFNTLQQVSWVRYGGIGYDTGDGLPTVAEKGEYLQLLWEDARVTADWVKKGGYLPLSLEMIDRDDLQAWKSVPKQLATAAVITLSSTISALFTDNSGTGPSITTEGSTANAFSSTWGNLINQPLDKTNWDLAVTTMYKLAALKNSTQTESVRIAVRPKFCLVSIEGESDAIDAATGIVKPGALADKRHAKRILPEENIITVPHWTNASNWAAVADPQICPFAGVGFRFGDQPEIFIPGQNNHLLWTNDVLPIKTRWFFAVSVIDPRGAVKSNAG